MRHEFRLADIGEGLEEAEIIAWMVHVGDRVVRDQPLIEVMTDKSNAELPAPTAGTIVELAGAVGDIINVGGLIAVIDEATNQPPTLAPCIPALEPRPQDEPWADSPERPGMVSSASSPPPRPKASPSTRRMAAARGLDLSEITGSGPGGRILLSDLDALTMPADPTGASPPAMPGVEAPAVQNAPIGRSPIHQREVVATDGDGQPDGGGPAEVFQGTVPLRGVRRAVAQNMAQSWSEIPHIHAFTQIDAEPFLDIRARLRSTKRAAFETLTPLTFFVAAVARALRSNPQANASINMTDETITYHPAVNVGVAVASEHGLVVPVLRHADELDFETLNLKLSQLVQGARNSSLSREQFRGGTVTITNFGSLGGEQALPLIRPPESLIIGFGSISKRPFVVDNQVVPRQTMHIVAGADHRLLDGDVTTSVLNEISDAISDPLRLVL